MSQFENSKRASLTTVHFRDLEIRILNLFRISKFELRISKGKLDHSVNFVVTKKVQCDIAWSRSVVNYRSGRLVHDFENRSPHSHVSRTFLDALGADVRAQHDGDESPRPVQEVLWRGSRAFRG